MDIVERRILIFTGITHFFTHFTMLLFPPLAVSIAQDFAMELNEVFKMSFLMYLLYGMAAIPWGYLADRKSPRLVLACGIMIAGISLTGAGLIRNPAGLPWFLAFVGLGNAAYHPAGLSLLSKGMAARGRAMGINGIFGNLGIATAPFFAGILAWSMGWRMTLVIFGIIGFLAGFAIAVVPFSVPRSEDRQSTQSISGVRVLPLFVLLCGVVVFVGLMYRSFTLVLPSWLESRMQSNLVNLSDRFAEFIVTGSRSSSDGLLAALVSGVIMLIGMGGQLFGGRLADRMDLKKAYLLFFTLALPFLLTGIFLSGWMALPFIGFYTFFVLGMQPIENSLYSVLIPATWRSSGFGIKFTLGFGVGSLAVRLAAFAEPRIGLQGVMLLTVLYLTLTIIMTMIFFLVGKKTILRHVQS